MLATQSEGFEKALPHGRNIDTKLSQAVVDDGLGNRRMLESLVLNDLQRTEPRALFASASPEETSVTRRAERDCTGSGEVSLRV